MNIGIIDAEIIGKPSHRFPNLACMKISSYYKSMGHNVNLLLSYDDVDNYDLVFLSKVFIKTKIPSETDDVSKTETNVSDYYKDNKWLQEHTNVKYGGTGFFYDNAVPLSYDIEHSMPDYHLYDNWVASCISKGCNPKEFTYYTDYSIGFLTRGCFRKCQFCVNRKYNSCSVASDINEFLDVSRPKLCFLDDNFFACPKWKVMIDKVKSTNKKFQFKQGLDERLLTRDKIVEMNTWNYDGDIIFAFDNIEDRELIVSKLDLIYSTIPDWKRQMKFYCFCGFDRSSKYDNNFWEEDILSLLVRIQILSQYSCLPYVMRHENYVKSPYRGLYDTLAAWCNQPYFFKLFSFEHFSKMRGMKSSEGYKKYKNNPEEYLKAYNNDRGASWIYFDNYASSHDISLMQYIPKQEAKFGCWRTK